MILIPIDRTTVKMNLNAGATHSRMAGPWEKETQPDGSWSVIREVSLISHLPVPEFSYDYLPTKVQCSNCKREFLHTKLESDSGRPVCYSDAICPHCQTWDCCELKYERPDYSEFRLIWEMTKK